MAKDITLTDGEVTEISIKNNQGTWDVEVRYWITDGADFKVKKETTLELKAAKQTKVDAVVDAVKAMLKTQESLDNIV
jgi:hypothetical protein